MIVHGQEGSPSPPKSSPGQLTNTATLAILALAFRFSCQRPDVPASQPHAKAPQAAEQGGPGSGKWGLAGLHRKRAGRMHPRLCLVGSTSATRLNALSTSPA